MWLILWLKKQSKDRSNNILTVFYCLLVIIALGGCSNDVTAYADHVQRATVESVVVESNLAEISVGEVVGESQVVESSANNLESVVVPASGALLPAHRIVAYYGNPLSKRMGILGEYDEDDMLERLQQEVQQWNDEDPAHPVIPALHLIAVVAQGNPGSSGKYRMIMPDEIVNKVYKLAQQNHAVLIIDIQTGHDDIRNILPRFEWILKQPDVHLGIDPEFNLVASGKTSWHGYAQYLIQKAIELGMGADFLLGSEHILPIPSSQYVQAAKRPLNSLLNTNKLSTTFGVTLENWQTLVDSELYKIQAINK